jgi:hypothetical protein
MLRVNFFITFKIRAKNFSLCHHNQAGSGAQPFSQQKGTWGSFHILVPKLNMVLSKVQGMSSG